MSNVFAFRCRTKEHPQPFSTLVVFSGLNGLTDNDLVGAITAETANSVSPEVLVLLCAASEAEKISAQLTGNDSVFASLSNHVACGLYRYDSHGAISKHSDIQGSAPAYIDEDSVRRQGLTKLFIKRGGYIDAPATMHFVKPSGRFSTRFLRASEALSEGAEIFFCALWILPYLNKNVSAVHFDTAAIASLPMAALLMAKLPSLPKISTFHSYDGKDDFPFNREAEELVLISASQSGTLAHNISKKIGHKSNVVTLFSTNGNAEHGTTICNLDFHATENPLGLTPVDASLVHTKKGSRPIKLIGEHFIAQIEQPRVILPSIKHAPEVIKTKLSRIRGRLIFRSNKSSLLSSNSIRSVWIDNKALIATELFAGWVKGLVLREIPTSTRAIIHSGQGESPEAFAELLKEEMSRQGADVSRLAVVSLDQIESEFLPRWEDEATVIIAGNVTGHGEDLMAISRALRQWAPNSNRVFLSVAAMPSSKQAYDQLSSNLRHPNHKYLTMLEIFIDRVRSGVSWEEERLLLQENDDNIPPELKTRLERLLKTGEGLENDLFLESKTKPLELRENFAFWLKDDEGHIVTGSSQADLFVCIAALLENMRTNVGLIQEDRLVNDAQTHSLLSASLFTRYNDGVIQAAFLRAALPIEMNYLEAPDQSKQFANLVCEMISYVNRPQGEALSEFLLAMALSKVQVLPKDLLRIQQKLSEEMAELSTVQKWLADKVIGQPTTS